MISKHSHLTFSLLCKSQTDAVMIVLGHVVLCSHAMSLLNILPFKWFQEVTRSLDRDGSFKTICLPSQIENRAVCNPGHIVCLSASSTTNQLY